MCVCEWFSLDRLPESTATGRARRNVNRANGLDEDTKDDELQEALYEDGANDLDIIELERHKRGVIGLWTHEQNWIAEHGGDKTTVLYAV